MQQYTKNYNEHSTFFFSLEKCDREESCTYWTHTSLFAPRKGGVCILYKNCKLIGQKGHGMSASGPKGCPHTGETKQNKKS